MQHRYVVLVLARELKRAGLPTNCLYVMRHTAASLLLAQGASMREVMEILGHSQMSLTSDTYAHVYAVAGKENAARMDRALG